MMGRIGGPRSCTFEIVTTIALFVGSVGGGGLAQPVGCAFRTGKALLPLRFGGGEYELPTAILEHTFLTSVDRLDGGGRGAADCRVRV